MLNQDIQDHSQLYLEILLIHFVCGTVCQSLSFIQFDQFPSYKLKCSPQYLDPLPLCHILVHQRTSMIYCNKFGEGEVINFFLFFEIPIFLQPHDKLTVLQKQGPKPSQRMSFLQNSSCGKNGSSLDRVKPQEA